MRYFGDCTSMELLENNTICVKEGNRIRNIRNEEDVDRELLVFVNNVTAYGESVIFNIPQDTPVRYAVLNISWR